MTRVDLEELERAADDAGSLEFGAMLVGVFPLMAAELRELREKDRGIQAGCSRCPYCTAVRKDEEGSK